MHGGDWRDVQEQKACLLKNNIVDPVEKLAKKKRRAVKAGRPSLGRSWIDPKFRADINQSKSKSRRRDCLDP